MRPIRLFDLLGVTNEQEAAALWPWDRVRAQRGLVLNPSPGNVEPLLLYLQQTLELGAVFPGASNAQAHVRNAPPRVGIVADLAVRHQGRPRVPLVFERLPALEIFLEDTVGLPGRVYVTSSERGTELVLEAVPVELRVSSEFLRPLRSQVDEATEPYLREPVRYGGPYSALELDSQEIVLRDVGGSSIFTRVRLRMTETFEFVLEPVAPISIGPCVLGGLACRGVHDLVFWPNPELEAGADLVVDPGDEAIGQPSDLQEELALEWRRHGFLTGEGVVTVRTLELDHSVGVPRFLIERIAETVEDNVLSPEVRREDVEFVAEDLVVPFGNFPLPVPLHGTLGLRRRITSGDGGEEAFDHELAPVFFEVVPLGWLIRVFRFVYRSPSSVRADLALLNVDAPPAAFDPPSSLRLSLQEDGLVQVGWQFDADGWQFFDLKRFLDVSVNLIGWKVGIQFEGIRAVDSVRDGARLLQLLADFAILGNDPEPDKAFALRTRSGKPVRALLRNVGFDRMKGPLRYVTADVWLPDGLDVVALGAFRLSLDEAGFETRDSGGRYAYLSGTSPLFGRGGVRLQRLRGRIGGASDAPPILLDGVALDLELAGAKIRGSGAFVERLEQGNELRELSFSASVERKIFGKDFRLGASAVYGSVRGPTESFRYWLAGLQISPVPLSGFELANVRALIADGLVPDLPQPDGSPQEMRLFRWYRGSGAGGEDALSMPVNRKPGDWKRVPSGVSFGAAMQVAASASKALRLDTFIFATSSPEQRALTAGVQALLFDNPDPVGYGAFEWDLDRAKWSFALGWELDIDRLLDSLPDFGAGLRISGSLFVGNQPTTVAAGQIGDVTTWPAFRFVGLRHSKMEVLVAACYQYVAGTVNALGVILRFRGEVDLKRVGLARFHLEAGVIAGRWRNESTGSASIFWLEGSLHIRLLRVFELGVFVRVEIELLGPSPRYLRMSLEVRLDTPWWLPDITLRLSHRDGTPTPEGVSALSVPHSGASAFDPASAEQARLLTPTPVPPATLDLRTLRTLVFAPASEPDLDALVPVNPDSVIALDFEPAMDDVLTIGENTPRQASTQTSGRLESRYRLVSLGIRRRPRFGPDAGTWTSVLAPEDTSVVGLESLAPAELLARFRSQVALRWNHDFATSQGLDPRQLLVNADVPFTLATADGETDDVAVRTEPGWPCCRGARQDAVWRVIDFEAWPLGARLPAETRAGRDSVHWLRGRPPVIASPALTIGRTRVARWNVRRPEAGRLVTIVFAEPAVRIELYLDWFAAAGGELEIATYYGATPVQRLSIATAASGPSLPLRFDGTAITSLELTLTQMPAADPFVLEVAQLRYLAARDHTDALVRRYKCAAANERLATDGRFAWLPNHDYELTVHSQIELEYEPEGTQTGDVVQRSYFRTRGLPGTNGAAAAGQELAPYVEATYPPPGVLLYRREPFALAFDERFNVLAPLDSGMPGMLPERRTLLEWSLAMSRVGGTADGVRLSQGSSDWFDDHAGAVVDGGWRPKLATEVTSPVVRHAEARDPLRRRFERLTSSPASCGQPPRPLPSRVFLHDPVDPDGSERWAARSRYRARLEPDARPAVTRNGFRAADVGAIQAVLETGDAAAWQMVDGALVPVHQGPELSFGIFGDETWGYYELEVGITGSAGRAGAAVAASADAGGTTALAAIVDRRSSPPRLQLIRRAGAAETVLASAELDPAGASPTVLALSAFDDLVRASVGEVSVQAPRGDARAGRPALLATEDCAIASLSVRPLAGFEAVFETSRFDGFPAHIRSFGGRPMTMRLGELGPVTNTVAALHGNGDDMAQVMKPGADPERRQRLHEQWQRALGVAIDARPDRLGITSLHDGSAIVALLLESPEPLPFSRDVELEAWRRIFDVVAPGGGAWQPTVVRAGGVLAATEAPLPATTPERVAGADEMAPPEVGPPEARIPLCVLSNGPETHALVVATDPQSGTPIPFPSGTYRFRFSIDRERWRSSGDPNARYTAFQDLVVRLRT